MNSWEDRNGTRRAQAESRRSVSRAVAERERGRRRLNAATATVGFASVVAAGAVAAVLPGSTHKTVTNSGSSSASTNTGGSSSNSGASGNGTANSGSGSGNSANSSNSSSGSSNLQAPAYTPVQSNGGGQVTSGGSSSW